MNKDLIKAVQTKVGATPDGIIGDKTLAAIAKALGVETPAPSTLPTQAEVRSGKSIYGRAGDETNLVNITPAYQLYYDGKAVKTIRVNKAISARVEKALAEILEAYGPEKIHALGLDRYSGSYNNRTTTSGKSMSMHAWGIALDFDAERNAYSMGKGVATLPRPECNKWWDMWEQNGAISLGRHANKDWMHL
ncbi:MAG: hypothetical protein MJ053_07350 [Elusimicrobiaceae bacterium]|nr:hypothetical protein [Elusimicrobiaceae bacterium]